MLKPLNLFIALRYVRSRHASRFSSFISASSTIGIALGVMVLIIVMSAMNGFEKALADKLLSIVPHAELIAVNEPIENWPKSIALVKQNRHIVAAAPVIKKEGLIQKGKQLKAVEIRGVDLALEPQVSSIGQYIKQGSWQALAQDHTAMIGQGIAKKLGIKLGDEVALLLPKTKMRGQNFNGHFAAPIKMRVKIAAIFQFGGTVDDTLLYMSLANAAKSHQTNTSNNIAVDGIRIKVDKVFNAPHIAREVGYNFDHYAYIYDWTYTQGGLFSDIQLVRMVMLIVLTLVIAVASFNIVSTLVMIVNEKRGDIATLKSMGAKPSLIMTSFMLQGMINGLLGTSVGGLLGVVIAQNLTAITQFLQQLFDAQFLSADVYFINYIPSQLQWHDVIVTVSIALVLTIFATLYPAWRATKVQPAQVLGQI